MPDQTVRFQPTPNPNAGKFIVGRKVVEGKASRSFYSADDAAGHPLATALFEVEGVASIFMVDDFITVTKHGGVSWEALIPQLQSVIERAYS